MRIKPNYLADRCATIIINAGGMLVIATIISIVFIITSVALPLFYPARTTELATTATQEQDIIAAQTDEYLKKLYLMHRDGTLTFSERQLQTFSAVASQRLRPNSSARVVASESHTPFQHTVVWEDGLVALVQVDPVRRQAEILHSQKFTSPPAHVFMRLHQKNIITVSVTTNEAKRSTKCSSSAVQKDQRGLEGGAGGLNTSEDMFGVSIPLKQTSPCAKRSEAQISIRSVASSTAGKEEQSDEDLDDFFASDDSEDLRIRYDTSIANISAVDVSADGLQTIVGTTQGDIHLLRPNADSEQLHTAASADAITAVKFIYGDRSIIVADRAGNVSAWQADTLTRFKTLPNHSQPITSFSKGHRSKLYTEITQHGELQANYLTSARQLTAVHQQRMLKASIAPRDDAFVTVSPTSAVLWKLDAPHPEISFKTLLQPVWYENYPRPEHVWQSSSASDDFEPKLGLLPLIYGTVKATFYALLLVLPLSIFAAIYVNQCASPRCRAIIKPVIEILASLPSVVIGFLAAMWLAPFLQTHLLAFLISLLLAPLVFLLFVFGWSLLPQHRIIMSVEQGQQYLLILPVICLSYLLAHACAQPCEAYLFQGDFLAWLYETWGIHYDQRNSIVIAFALGFAVAPIIFSITEDSLATVPPALTSSSLALGASKWQTIWRVLLPSASPGIFAAAIIGLGRAVGETMIVLMATGNTPIMDSSPFNGMRTLAANIAVEVPEAPVDSTLYRTLYLCAALLFVLTFCFNTLAELVRTKLRGRYVNI
ncbi:MAG: ABC transporter permease subunit [Pseudomonadota bacterium]|nr:ABC transporter permease subunit [Pseudomonadota bacterium]